MAQETPETEQVVYQNDNVIVSLENDAVYVKRKSSFICGEAAIRIIWGTDWLTVESDDIFSIKQGNNITVIAEPCNDKDDENYPVFSFHTNGEGILVATTQSDDPAFMVVDPLDEVAKDLGIDRETLLALINRLS